MSTILDALKKASEEQGHVRSPIAKGELFTQTRPTQRRPDRSGGSFPGVAHIAIALSMLVLIAVVAVVIVLWASNTAGRTGGAATGPVATPEPQPAVTPPTPPAPQPPPPTTVAAAVPTVTPGDLAPPHQAQPPASRIDRYMQTQRGSTPVPIPLQIATLPPPEPLADELLDDLDRDWDSELDDEEITEIEPPAPPEPEFRLEGIVYDDSNPMAIVNGVIVSPGDSVRGAQVVSITIDSVTLSVHGEEVILSH
ncbi:hypothetical protein JXA47_14950 [Candidatus Sumerlaeota bacterium]|nr:hypothetical protein [Candidatus Sumerlaeota bacterium]